MNSRARMPLLSPPLLAMDFFLCPPRLTHPPAPPCHPFADTATSPAPHMPLAHLVGQRDLAAAVAATLTGGGPAVALKGRPPLPSRWAGHLGLLLSS